MPTDPTQSAAARRIDALLAKAASTEYGEEAEACVAKAQELIARYAIDDAMLRGAGADRNREVVLRVVHAERPYASARSALLSAIARNNHCRVVLHGTDSHGQRCTVIGHAADVSHVESLFVVLSLHATRALFAAAPVERPKSYRHGFLLAYASRVSERLRSASDAARADAVRETGRSADLVLIERWAAVDRVVRSEFPLLTSARRQASSSAGFAGGRAAADRAPLAGRRIGGPLGLPKSAR